MDIIKNYRLRHSATDIEAKRKALLHKVELREIASQPLHRIPSRSVAKANKKASNRIDSSRQPLSMLNMGQPIFYRATVSDEKTKNLFRAWRKRLDSGKLG
jgi:hypothetical protein